MNDDHPSQTLATFAATLKFDDIPAPVMRRAEDLLLDWFGSALAGKAGRPVQAIEWSAGQMGPREGPSEVLISRRATSPLFAAMVNAASSHYAEQDDVHNGSVFHSAAVVFPAALAVAQAIGASGRDFLTAAVAGYEVGIRIGEFLGRSHYRIFHTTGTAGTVAAAAAAGRLLNLAPEQMLHAFGSAGTQAYNDPGIAAFRAKVDMQLDEEVDTAYPARWIGKVTVVTTDGRVQEGRVDEPKGDPGNTLTRDELEQKALRLAEFSGAAGEAEMRAAFARIWELAGASRVETFFTV